MRQSYIHFGLFIVLLLLGNTTLTLHAQTTKKYAKDVEDRIKKVEHNLASWVQTEGSNKWTLEERMKFYHANGVSIAVIKNYKIDWAKGYGWADSAAHRPVTASTLFQAGSISKSLNGVGVLKLVQEGKLNLYTDINEYLKTWKFPYDTLANGKKITTANLLSHTAGLTVHGFPGYALGDSVPTIIQVLDGKRPANTAPVRSQFEPSLRFQYSGGGTTLSQLIVQDVSGEPYDEYMWKNVLKPMGMTNSFYTQPPAKEKQDLLATGYYNDGKEVKGKYHIYPEQAAAGLWTNPTDLAKYIIETQLALKGKSAKVLSQQMTKLRLTPYIDSAAALGVFIIKRGGEKYFNHGGVDEGFVSQYFGSMETGNGVVVMVNADNTAILDEIINSVATVYNWKDFYKPVIKKIVKVEDNVLENYVGKYKLREDTLSITKEDNDLFLHTGDGNWKLYFTSGADFFMYEAAGAEQTFTKDNRGKVDGIYIRQGNFQMKAKKI